MSREELLRALAEGVTEREVAFQTMTKAEERLFRLDVEPGDVAAYRKAVLDYASACHAAAIVWLRYMRETGVKDVPWDS